MAQNAKEENVKKVFTSKAGGEMKFLVQWRVMTKNRGFTLEDKDSLQILLISCMNDVIKQSDENKKMMAMNMMGGLFFWTKNNSMEKLPSLFEDYFIS